MKLIIIEIKIDEKWIRRELDEYVEFFRRCINRISGLNVRDIGLVERTVDNFWENLWRILNEKYSSKRKNEKNI